jgi:hypothetical protein
MILILIAELFYDTSIFHRNCIGCFIANTFTIIGYMLCFPINFPCTFCTMHAHAVDSVEAGRHDRLWWEPLLPSKHRRAGGLRPELLLSSFNSAVNARALGRAKGGAAGCLSITLHLRQRLETRGSGEERMRDPWDNKLGCTHVQWCTVEYICSIIFYTWDPHQTHT